MAIAPGRVSADPAETPDGERVIVPTSIYAPGTLVDAQPDGEGAATGAPPHPGQAPGPGAGPAAGYPASPSDPGMGQATSPDYGPPPASDPGYGASADRGANPPGEHPYGNYAYVIRDEEPPAPRPRATGPGMRSPASQPPQESPQPEPDTAYGPDDPAYGPPSAGWYSSEDQAAEEPQHARGVFEPPRNQGGSGQDPADDTPPLEQIRDFYLTAEAISADNLGRDFDELLERQRQLISAYFTEAALQEDPR
jgi:hypothetical protein